MNDRDDATPAWKDALAASAAPVALIDGDGRLAWANDAFAADCAAPPVPGTPWQAALGIAAAVPAPPFAAVDLRGPEGRCWRASAAVLGDGSRFVLTCLDRREAVAQAERAAELAQWLELAQQFGRLGLWERDPRSFEGWWDPSMRRFWDLDDDEPTPTFLEAQARIHPDDRSDVRFREAMHRVGLHDTRFRVQRKGGGWRHLHSQLRVIGDAEGVPVRAIGVTVDDSEAWALARSAEDAAAQLEAVLHLGRIAIWRHDLVTNRMHYNARAVEVLGLPAKPEGYPLEFVRELIHPDDLPAVMASAEQAIGTDRPVDIEARYRHADGSWRHVLTRRFVQRRTDGTVSGFVGVAFDVTERVVATRRAEALRHRLELAADAAGIAIWSLDTETDDAFWNEQMYRLHGRPPAAGPVGWSQWLALYVHPDDKPSLQQRQREREQGLPQSPETAFRIVRPGGEVRWVVSRATIEPDSNGQQRMGVMIDVTERHLAELALREAAQRAALAARGAGIGTWEVDWSSGFASWDEPMFRLRGLEPAAVPPDAAGRLALVHPDDRAHVRSWAERMRREGGSCTYEFRIVRPDGQVRWLASRSVPVSGVDDGRARRIGVNWDITDARLAEEARRAQALAQRESEAKSRFLARMSHELRTPLNAILGFAQLLQADVDERGSRAERQRRLGHVRDAGQHLLALIDDVLDLSRIEAGEASAATRVELAAAVAQAVALVETQAQARAVTVHRHGLDGLAVRADATRLRQVLLNLLTNAVKYNRIGGRIDVSGRAAADGFVVVEVRDSGRGLEATQLARLFQPFERLGAEREGIEGTGIGLMIVKATVERMGGSIAVRSTVGQGSTFELRLPAAATEPLPLPQVAAGGPAGAAARPALAGRVLYIEDNEVNVLVLAELLARHPGIAFASAATGAEGVERARTWAPDLVLVDMHLPDFGGMEVLARLRADAATRALPCVALSANAISDDIAGARAAGFADYLTKPVDFAVLLATLARLLPR